MAKRDYYDVLGVPRNADSQQIKKAYRKLAKKYHPDTNHGDANAEQMFKEVTEAYNVLSNEEKRKLYDQFGHAAFDGSTGENPEDFAGNGGFNFHQGQSPNGSWTEYRYTGNMDDIFGDMFGSFFGGHARSGSDPFTAGGDFGYRNQPSADITSEITISFREAALGCEKVISFNDSSIGSLSVKIPAGISDGKSIRLKGKGRHLTNGHTGDLLIEIHIRKDARFTRDGNDVYITESIPYTTAALGGEATFDTLYGAVKCYVPAGSQSGSKLRLKNKGIVSMKNPNIHGDEYVTLQIDVPRNLSEREKALLRQLQSIEQQRSA
jgi:molecular chaperone DnaJ